MLHTASGAAHLLVVGDGRGGRAQVHHEAQVGLVEAHAERGGGDQCLDLVGEQILLGLLAIGVLRLARVRRDRVPPLPQEGGDLFGGCHGEGVDDSGPRQFVEVFREPGHPVRGVRQSQHAQAQAVPVQRAPQHEGIRAAAGAELFRDVGRHARVGRGGGGEHRHTGWEIGEHRAQPAVVRPEVVSPVGDAVGLVHHEEPRGGRETGSTWSRKSGLLSRSGLTRRTSTSPAAISS